MFHVKTNVEYFPLQGRGPKYTLKKKRPFKFSKLSKDVTLFTDRLNSDSNSGDLYLKEFRFIQRRAEMIMKTSLHQLNGKKKLSEQVIIKLITKIIPASFLITLPNFNKFMKIIRLNLTRSHNEQIYAEVLSTGFDLNIIQWLPDKIIDAELRSKLFADGVKFVLFHVIFPFIHKFFKFVPTRAYGLLCFTTQAYNRVVSVLINHLKSSGIIALTDNQDFARKAAYLSLKPKDDKIRKCDLNSFRIIALLPKRHDTDLIRRKQINKSVYLLAREASFVKTQNFFEEWKMYVGNRQKRLFIVKLDVSDCFGNIPTDELISLISFSSLSPFEKRTLLDAVNNQFIMFGKKGRRPILWKWNRGLLQGMGFSSALCEFYLTHLESTLFSEFNTPDCFIYRKVDDYFFASTKRNNVFQFVEKAKSKLKINELKTQSNIMLQFTTLINFCGLEINTQTFRIKCVFNKDMEMHKRFRFWNVRKPIEPYAMLDRAVCFDYNNFYFQPALMDIQFNGMNHVLVNFFESMIFIALKLDTAIMSAMCGLVRQCHTEKIVHVIMGTIKICIKHVLRLNLKKFRCIPFLYQKLMIVGLRAMELAFKRRHNQVYDDIVKIIQKFMKEEIQTNKWFYLFQLQFQTIPRALRIIKTKRSCLFFKALCESGSSCYYRENYKM